MIRYAIGSVAAPNSSRKVNTAQTEAELAVLRHSIGRGCPFGEMSWSVQMARRLGPEMTLRPHGRPKKQPNGSRHLFFLGTTKKPGPPREGRAQPGRTTLARDFNEKTEFGQSPAFSTKAFG